MEETVQCNRCPNTFPKDAVHDLHLDIEEGVMIHVSFPINQVDGEVISLCKDCLQSTFQEFMDNLNPAQKQFMRDQARKQAIDVSILSLVADMEE